jgi:6-phosphofructokinase 2
LLGKSLTGLDELAAEACRIQQQGVNYVCISLGQDGALLVGPDNTYKAATSAVKVCAGAGDAMGAGITAAFSRNASAQAGDSQSEEE